MLNLKSLNDNQRKAVEWKDGPLLILAGPGSGKTRVLTMRVAKLLSESPDERFRILALTFTNKAAAEMRERVDDMVHVSRERALLTTFHSFCADVLRQHGSHVGLKPDFVILNQIADQEAVLYDAIKKIQREDEDIDETDVKILPLLERLQNECIEEEHIVKRASDIKTGKKILKLYRAYKQELVENNRLDFSMLLTLTRQLLMQKPAIVKQIQIIYKYICVDEFQDTNHAQYKVLQLIVNPVLRNLFVVADDDQIIYQWNGANPERLKSLREDFDMEVIQLPANYRCPPEVIELANKLIKQNLDRSPGKEPLRAMKKNLPGDILRLKAFSSIDEELSWISQDIAERSHIEHGQCVILGRTRRLLESAADALKAKGITASLVIRKNEFESAPLRWLHAILRLANSRGDREQLRRLCKAFYELEGIDVDIQDITSESPLHGGDFLRSWLENLLVREELEEYTKPLLLNIRNQLVERLDFHSFVRDAYEWFSKVEEHFAGAVGEGFTDYNEERETWDELFDDINRKFAREELTLNVFLQELDLSPKSPPVPPNAVRCLTIHSAKGMEFDHVYLIGLAEDQLPSFQSIKKGNKSREMQEERRNCFVAVTRAQRSLTLTYSTDYYGWPKRPSRFLSEMGLVAN